MRFPDCSILQDTLSRCNNAWSRFLTVSRPAPTGSSDSTNTNNGHRTLWDKITNPRMTMNNPQAAEKTEETQKQETQVASTRERLQSIFNQFKRIFWGFFTNKEAAAEGSAKFSTDQNGNAASVVRRKQNKSQELDNNSAGTSSRRDSLEVSDTDWYKHLENLGSDEMTVISDHCNNQALYSDDKDFRSCTFITKPEGIIVKGRSGEDFMYGAILKNSNPFFKASEFLLNLMAHVQQKCQLQSMKSGSTVCMTLVTRNQQNKIAFTIANLGDAGCTFLIRKPDRSLLRVKLTEDHSPDNPRIKQHIEKNGGRVEHLGCYGWRVRESAKLGVGASLGDTHFRSLRRIPDIFHFEEETSEWQVLDKLIKENGILGGLQEVLENDLGRLVCWSDGIESGGNQVIHDAVGRVSKQGIWSLDRPEYPQDKAKNDYWAKNQALVFSEKNDHEEKDSEQIQPGSDDVTVTWCNLGATELNHVQAMGVFDGHYGEAAAKLVKQEMKMQLSSALKQSSEIWFTEYLAQPQQDIDSRNVQFLRPQVIRM